MEHPQTYNETPDVQTIPTANSNASLGTLFSNLTEDVSVLMRKEVELARTETMESVSKVLRSAVSMIAGGVIAYAGIIVLLMAAAFGLANVIPLWVSALVIGLVTIVVGAIMIMAGRSAISTVNVVPEKTVQTLKNDARMVKEKLS